MGNFNTFNRGRGNGFGARDSNRGGSERRNFGSREWDHSQMHEATCSDCGKRCEVPFRPTGEKPVYCNQCFSIHRGSTSAGPARRDFGRPGFGERKPFESGNNNTPNQYKEQFDLLNGKLDKILGILVPATAAKEEKKEKVDEKKKETTEKKIKESKKDKKK
jgi:CxxC-x17-CxxC domain-containing protein